MAFIDEVIKFLVQNRNDIHWILMGKKAADFEAHIKELDNKAKIDITINPDGVCTKEEIDKFKEGEFIRNTVDKVCWLG